MTTIKEWIDDHLQEISKKLPDLIHQDPTSFACGYNTGYKSALNDLGEFLKGCARLSYFQKDSGMTLYFYVVKEAVIGKGEIPDATKDN